MSVCTGPGSDELRAIDAAPGEVDWTARLRYATERADAAGAELEALLRVPLPHHTSHPPAMHRGRAFLARLMRRRFRTGDPSPCHGERLVADPWNPWRVLCPVRGERYLSRLPRPRRIP